MKTSKSKELTYERAEPVPLKLGLLVGNICLINVSSDEIGEKDALH